MRRRPLKQLQLTSHSFTTLEPPDDDDQSELRPRPPQVLPHSRSLGPETTRSDDLSAFSPSEPTSLTLIGGRRKATDQSDEATQTDISVIGADDAGLLLAASGTRPQRYTTSLYIETMPIAPVLNIPYLRLYLSANFQRSVSWGNCAL